MWKNKKIYIVGAGPGSPDLITLKGFSLLKEADVIIYDSLTGKGILNFAKKSAELICADKFSSTQKGKRIAYLILKKLREGKNVIRLKNGDPFIFGRITEEMEELSKYGVKFEVVPGITSATAGACFAGLPLTSRNISSSVVFVTGHEDPFKESGFVDWEKVSKIDTIVLYMATKNISSIARTLIKNGKSPSTPVAVISNVSMPDQKMVIGNLSDIGKKVKEEKIAPPSIIIVGEVVKLGERLNWFSAQKKVLYTGLISPEFFGEDIIFHIPMVEVKPTKEIEKFKRFIKSLPEFELLIFTSRWAVNFFFEKLLKIGLDSRVLSPVKIACSTKSASDELKGRGILADFVPSSETSQELLNFLHNLGIAEKKVGVVSALSGDRGLCEGIKKLNGIPYKYTAYKIVTPKYLLPLNLQLFDEIIFSSPSAVRNFLERYGKPPERVRIIATNTKTFETLIKLNLISERRLELDVSVT
jgi:uroporphyrinogen III methyltransferase/synthase